MPDLLDELNESQREAASHTDGAMLILAGARSEEHTSELQSR